MPPVVVNVPVPEARCPPKPPFADRVERLDGLVAGSRARRPTGRASSRPAPGRGRSSRTRPRRRRRRARARARRRATRPVADVEHREEDPEVEERAAEVVRLDEDEHRRAPDQRAAGRSPSAGPGRAPRASRAGSRRGRRSARSSRARRAGTGAARRFTQSRAPLIRRADHGQRRQHQQADRREAEQVLVALEHAEVVAQQEQRQRERADADDDPEALPERVGRVEPVDLGDARSRSAGRSSGSRYGSAHGTVKRVTDVRDEVEAEEDQRVRDRAGRDHRLPGDVDAREARGPVRTPTTTRFASSRFRCSRSSAVTGPTSAS